MVAVIAVSVYEEKGRRPENGMISAKDESASPTETVRHLVHMTRANTRDN